MFFILPLELCYFSEALSDLVSVFKLVEAGIANGHIRQRGLAEKRLFFNVQH